MNWKENQLAGFMKEITEEKYKTFPLNKTLTESTISAFSYTNW